ncbi:MAG: 50S ribosomal protein L10 [Minwuia sp.]|uniref:50S ribosomal protein L10 n=1 Tax=Minwuia sp. TaxID=2493630 RepID=UPI003A865421
MNREEKAAAIDELRGVFGNASTVVVTQYKGLSVAEMTDLRNQVREAGASYKVIKNRLAKIALEGSSYSGLTDYFTGPTAISYSDDPVAAAKATVDYAKKNDKLVIISGAMGEQVLDESGVKALADLPSLDELRAKLLGLIQAPATKLAQVTQAPASKLARVLNAYATKEDA